MSHEQIAATAPRRVHAAGQHPHRGLALSGRHPGRELQLRPYQALRPDPGARQVRRVLHGRPSRRAEHADERAEAQRHRHLVRSGDPAAGAGGGDRAARADRDRLDDLRRALSRRPPLRLARSSQRRARRLERRHHLQPGCGAQLRARGARRARRALSPRARVLRRGHRAVGQLGRRCLRARRGERHLLRSRQAACARSQGQVFLGARAAQHRAADPGLAGDRAGRRVGGRPPARGRDRRSRCSPASATSRRRSASMPT